MSYNITKSAVEVYRLRHEKSFYWADITLDVNIKAGRISIASDFGDYQYYWGACGKPFKEFLLQLDLHYTAGKFRADEWFDQEATIKTYKRQVIEYRREWGLHANHAREIWDEIVSLEDFTQQDEFVYQLRECDKLMNWYDGCPDIEKDITPQFKRFWSEIWPVFTAQLKAELQEAA